MYGITWIESNARHVSVITLCRCRRLCAVVLVGRAYITWRLAYVLLIYCGSNEREWEIVLVSSHVFIYLHGRCCIRRVLSYLLNVFHQSLLLYLSPRIPMHSNVGYAYLDQTFHYLHIFWGAVSIFRILYLFFNYKCF